MDLEGSFVLEVERQKQQDGDVHAAWTCTKDK